MSEDPDDLRAQIVQAAVRGWEANLDGRSVVEQALTRAVLVCHLLLGFSAQPPDAQRLEEAFDLLNSVQPGLFATWESSRGIWLHTGDDSPGTVVAALWAYLLQALRIRLGAVKLTRRPNHR